MRRSALSVPLLLLAGVSLVGCSAAEPEYEGVAPATFAKTACTDWVALEELQEANEDLPFSLTGSGEEQHAQVLEAAQAQIDRITTARDAIQKNPPAVKDGEKIAAAFVSYYDELLAITETRVEDFTGFPTELSGNNDQISIEAISVFSDISSHSADAPKDFPFTATKDQDIIAAYDDEPACDGVVTVMKF